MFSIIISKTKCAVKAHLLLIIVLSCCVILIGCQSFSQKPALSYKTEVYFSPDGHASERIIKAIDSTKESIDIAIFDFTSSEIKASLERAKGRGAIIRIIADSRQAGGAHSVINSLASEGVTIKVAHGKGRGIMHNKFAIFDKSLLVTGSYNWTDNAERFNYENAIFVSDPNLIKQYQSEFDQIWNKISADIFSSP